MAIYASLRAYKEPDYRTLCLHLSETYFATTATIPRKTAAAKEAAAEAARVAKETADKIAMELRKRAMEVDRWITSLDYLTDPTTGPAKHSNTSQRYKRSLVHFLELGESWDSYQNYYYNAPRSYTSVAERIAHIDDYTDRMERYEAVVASAQGIEKCTWPAAQAAVEAARIAAREEVARLDAEESARVAAETARHAAAAEATRIAAEQAAAAEATRIADEEAARVAAAEEAARVTAEEVARLVAEESARVAAAEAARIAAEDAAAAEAARIAAAEATRIAPERAAEEEAADTPSRQNSS